MTVLNFLYGNSYHFFNIIIIIILFFLLSTYFVFGGEATEPTIFQYFKAKFDQHSFL